MNIFGTLIMTAYSPPSFSYYTSKDAVIWKSVPVNGHENKWSNFLAGITQPGMGKSEFYAVAQTPTGTIGVILTIETNNPINYEPLCFVSTSDYGKTIDHYYIFESARYNYYNYLIYDETEGIFYGALQSGSIQIFSSPTNFSQWNVLSLPISPYKFKDLYFGAEPTRGGLYYSKDRTNWTPVDPVSISSYFSKTVWEETTQTLSLASDMIYYSNDLGKTFKNTSYTDDLLVYIIISGNRSMVKYFAFWSNYSILAATVIDFAITYGIIIQGGLKIGLLIRLILIVVILLGVVGY